jgi:Holliday junction DNA helicase RuvB
MTDDLWKRMPDSLEQFVGQALVIKNIQITLKAAKINKKMPDHILLCGNAGLGKTTIAKVIAKELKTNMVEVIGGLITGKKDVYSVIDYIRTSPNLIIFIDEIHRIPKRYGEVLYSVMQDFQIEGEKINRFTLVGATTSPGMLVKPMRDRFKHVYTLDYYPNDEMVGVINTIIPGISPEIAMGIASRTHGVPRIAKNLLTEIKNTAIIDGREMPTKEDLDSTLERLGVDDLGLTNTDRKILEYVGKNEPVAERTLCSVQEMTKDDLNFVHESVLMRLGLYRKTGRGRKLTRAGKEYVEKWT